MSTWNDYFTPLIYLNISVVFIYNDGTCICYNYYELYPDVKIWIGQYVMVVNVTGICFSVRNISDAAVFPDMFAQDAFVKGVMMSGLKD